MTLEEAAAIVKPHADKIKVEARLAALDRALMILSRPGRFTDIWQVRDFATLVHGGLSPEAAISEMEYAQSLEAENESFRAALFKIEETAPNSKCAEIARCTLAEDR